jgi:hypothetical protein
MNNSIDNDVTFDILLNVERIKGISNEQAKVELLHLANNSKKHISI